MVTFKEIKEKFKRSPIDVSYPNHKRPSWTDSYMVPLRKLENKFSFQSGKM